MLCQFDYLANILAKYIFRVYEEFSANHFLTNIFTHTKLHQHVRLILINSLANILAQFVPVYNYELKTLPLIFGEIVFQMIDF